MDSGPSPAVLAWSLRTAFVSKDEKHHVHPETGSETWRRTKHLGTGGFGDVWQETCTSGTRANQARAVKQIRKRKDMMALLGRELDILVALSTNANHPRYLQHFVQFYGWFADDLHLFIAMEYVPHGDLQSYVGRQIFTEQETAVIVSQVATALECMHTIGIVHRDLKPANILVANPRPSWHVKITDFGISKNVEGTALKTRVGTDAYMAPELYESSHSSSGGYTNAVDIWALGAVAYCIRTGSPPFASAYDIFMYKTGQKDFPMIPLMSSSAGFMLFIQMLMAKLPATRASIEQVLDHQWLKSLGQVAEPVPGNAAPQSNIWGAQASAAWNTSMSAAQANTARLMAGSRDATSRGQTTYTPYRPSPNLTNDSNVEHHGTLQYQSVQQSTHATRAFDPSRPPQDHRSNTFPNVKGPGEAAHPHFTSPNAQATCNTQTRGSGTQNFAPSPQHRISRRPLNATQPPSAQRTTEITPVTQPRQQSARHQAGAPDQPSYSKAHSSSRDQPTSSFKPDYQPVSESGESSARSQPRTTNRWFESDYNEQDTRGPAHSQQYHTQAGHKEQSDSPRVPEQAAYQEDVIFDQSPHTRQSTARADSGYYGQSTASKSPTLPTQQEPVFEEFHHSYHNETTSPPSSRKRQSRKNQRNPKRTCLSCGLSFTNRNDLFEHIEAFQHGVDPDTFIPEPYERPSRGRSQDVEGSEAHEERPQSPGQTPAAESNYKFLRYAHKDPRHVCLMCGRYFSDRNLLFEHIAAENHGVDPSTFEAEPFEARSRREHSNQFVQETLHTCLNCGSKFPSRNMLFSHLRETGHGAEPSREKRRKWFWRR